MKPPRSCGIASGVGHFKNQAAHDRFAAAYDDAFALLPDETERLVLNTSFGQVCCYRFGASPGPPIVLLSGRNASTPMWRVNLPSLMELGSVYCLDSVGEAGRSTQTRALTVPRDQACWVAEALAELGLGRVHLVGSSLGGWLAVQVAIHRPASLRSVVVLDPPATFAPLSRRFIAAGLCSVLPGSPEWLQRRLVGWIAGGAPGHDDSAETRLAMAALRGYRVRQPVPRLPTTEQLRGIRTPVLAVIAGRSRVHDPRAAVARAAALAEGMVELWPDAGHTLHGQFPQRFAQQLEEFLTTIGISGSGS